MRTVSSWHSVQRLLHVLFLQKMMLGMIFDIINVED